MFNNLINLGCVQLREYVSFWNCNILWMRLLNNNRLVKYGRYLLLQNSTFVNSTGTILYMAEIQAYFILTEISTILMYNIHKKRLHLRRHSSSVHLIINIGRVQLSEYVYSLTVFVGAQSLVFFIVFCRSLFGLLSFSF